jgi:hypothetical protein
MIGALGIHYTSVNHHWGPTPATPIGRLSVFLVLSHIPLIWVMVLLLSSALLFGAFIHSIRGQTTTAPPASTPTVGPTPLPLTQYTFTYPNLVRRRCLLHVVVLTLSFLAAAASLPFQFWTWTSDWLQYLQLDHGTSSLTNEQSVMGVDVHIYL